MQIISFRADEQTRNALRQLAEHEERQPSDVLRRLVREAARKLRDKPLKKRQMNNLAGGVQ